MAVNAAVTVVRRNLIELSASEWRAQSNNALVTGHREIFPHLDAFLQA